MQTDGRFRKAENAHQILEEWAAPYYQRKEVRDPDPEDRRLYDFAVNEASKIFDAPKVIGAASRVARFCNPGMDLGGQVMVPYLEWRGHEYDRFAAVCAAAGVLKDLESLGIMGEEQRAEYIQPWTRLHPISRVELLISTVARYIRVYDESLHEYSQRFADRLFAVHPEWRDLAVWHRPDPGFGLRIPAPSGSCHLGIGTDGSEITVSFRHHPPRPSDGHEHFGWGGEDEPAGFARALGVIEDILTKRTGDPPGV